MVDCMWRRKRQPWMDHLAGLEHNIRQEGIGDRVAWGEWCYEEFKKERGQGEEKRSLNGARIWCANFLIRRGQSRHFLGEWFDDESIPSGRRRRMMQLVLVNFPCGEWVHDKIDPQQSDRCSMCRRALRMERGSSFSEVEVPRETVEHISGTGCKGQEEVVTLARKNSFRI